jgi:CRISPR-associated protein Cas1
MRAVYVDRKHAELAAEGNALVVRVPGERATSLPLPTIERLVVRGPARLDTRLLAELWRQDAGLLLLSGRRNEPTARLLGRPHADAALRLAQYRLQLDRPARAAVLTGVAKRIDARTDDVRAYPVPRGDGVTTLGRPILPQGIVTGGSLPSGSRR